MKQQKEIEQADLEGLEKCPFCDCKYGIEADKAQDKLFGCENICKGYGVVSYRECKRLDHLPKSCKEKVLDGLGTCH
jgi:TRIAD3 protein (E3 ubiquitin-protein ligase RNF216)